MEFNESELEMIYQYAAADKAATLAGLQEIVPVIQDLLTKVIVERTIEKLQKVPEPECSQFIADTKAYFLEKRDNSIRRQLAEAKAKQPVMQGHDLMGLERFMEDTRHMITFDVLNNDSPVGYRGERYRCFLSDERYQNARKSEQRGEIKIRSHAAVAAGHLYPDKKPEIDR